MEAILVIESTATNSNSKAELNHRCKEDHYHIHTCI